MQKRTRRKAPLKPTTPEERHALVAEICSHLPGGASLEGLFKQNVDRWPSQNTFFTWIRTEPALLELYEQAAEARAEKFADEVVAIADEEPPDVTDQFGNTRKDGAWINWQRVRIDARKWTAAHLRPHRWGDKNTEEVADRHSLAALLRQAAQEIEESTNADPALD